jgi:vacuolar-type H+-ATPase subunit H
VPASLGGDVASELAPVFAALDRLEQEAEEFRARSEAALARRAHDAEEEADEILAEARARADWQRDDALSAGLKAAEADVAGIVSQGEADAKRIREAGERRLPGFVAEALARVLKAGS